MVSYFIFFGKLAFLMFVVTVFVAMLSALLALIIEKLFGVKPVRNYAYSILACPALVYFYGLVVAGFHVTIDCYVKEGHTGWILYLLAGAIWAFVGYVHLSNFRDYSIRNEATGRKGDESGFTRFAYKFGLIGYNYAALSFIISIFKADFYFDLYFGFPNWYAMLFL